MFESISQLQNDAIKLFSPITKQFDLSFYVYMRFYKDKGTVLLCNNPKLYDFLFKNNHLCLAPFDEGEIEKRFFSIINFVDGYKNTMSDVQKEFEIGYAIDFVEVHDDYVDVVCLCTKPGDFKTIHLMANHADAIELISSEIAQRHEALDKHDARACVEIPSTSMPDLSRLFDKVKQQHQHEKIESALNECLPERLNALSNPLSPRELECVKFAVMGESSKQIAQRMDISFRTVDHHLESARHKFNVSRKSALINYVLNFMLYDFKRPC